MKEETLAYVALTKKALDALHAHLTAELDFTSAVYDESVDNDAFAVLSVRKTESYSEWLQARGAMVDAEIQLMSAIGEVAVL